MVEMATTTNPMTSSSSGLHVNERDTQVKGRADTIPDRTTMSTNSVCMDSPGISSAVNNRSDAEVTGGDSSSSSIRERSLTVRSSTIQTDTRLSNRDFASVMRAVINSTYFDFFMDVVLLVFALLFVTSENPTISLSIQIAINSLEIALRFVFKPVNTDTQSWFNISRNFSNFLYVMCLVGSSVVYFLLCTDGDKEDRAVCHHRTLNGTLNWRMRPDVLLLIMMIRASLAIRSTFVLRNVSWDILPEWAQKELTRAVDIISETYRGFKHLLLALALIIYVFAATGQMMFGGQLSKNPSLPHYHQLMDSVYAEYAYWPLNFNDMPSSIVAVFTLLYVNNMYVLASGCVAVSNQASQIFFAAYYLLGVLFLRNIFTSFLWSRIGKILDYSYKPVVATESREDFFRKVTDVLKVCIKRYDNVWATMETAKKAKTRNVESMINAEMSLIESTGVLLQYSRLGETHALFKKRSSLLAFRLRYKYVYPLLGCCWALTFIRVWQKPYWLIVEPEKEGDLYPYFLSNASYMSPGFHTAVKVPLFCVIIAALCVEIVYKADGSRRMRELHISVVVRYVFCYTIVLPSFLVCDVSVSLLSVYRSLLAFSDTTWRLTIIPLPLSIINRHNTHITYDNAGTSCCLCRWRH
jgi:hypothetical protein